MSITTTTSLIKTILRRASIPNDQSTFTDDDIIEMMNEEFMSNVLPVVLKVHEEYYVTPQDFDIDPVTRRIQIPYRAIGNRLREVHYIDGNGSSFNMSKIALEDLPDHSDSYNYNKPLSFHIENDEIVLLGNQESSAGQIRMFFFMRPNKLVTDDRVPSIVSLAVYDDAGTSKTDLILSSFPTVFTAGADYDFIAKRTPNKLRAYDKATTAVDSTLKKVTFLTADIPTGLAEGDFLALAEETHVPQLPVELTPILSQRTAIKCLEAMGDTEAMSNASRELNTLENNAYTLIDNRVEGAPTKVINRNSQLKTNQGFFGTKRRR